MAKDTATCNDIVLSAIKRARSALEALAPMSFSVSVYLKLPKIKQLFVTVNLERMDRGLPPMAYLTKSLDSIAQVGADKNEDPPLSLLPKSGQLPGGGRIVAAGANWAGGYDNPLGSDYGWMYDDGYDSPNADCTTPEASGCWGHRDNILGTFVRRSECTTTYESVMGAGYVSGSKAPYGDSETELFVGVCGPRPTDVVASWSKLKTTLHAK